ncbi:MAG: septum formation initiator family protein [Nitrospiraceae bacterium]|nr:septum formation initiator family protein [Nitrospiraceae bacterium]
MGGGSGGDALWRQIRAERKRRDYVFWTVIVLCLAYLAMSLLFGDMGYLKLRTLEARGRALKGQVAAIKQENARIETAIERFGSDKFYQEKRARDELGMAKKNEYIFIFNGPDQ